MKQQLETISKISNHAFELDEQGHTLRSIAFHMKTFIEELETDGLDIFDKCRVNDAVERATDTIAVMEDVIEHIKKLKRLEVEDDRTVQE